MNIDNNIDNHVDDEIYSYLNIDSPKSFFLFAGAGSGKTRTLVNVLKRIKDNNSQKFRLNGHRIAIITYTNAACDEIKHRLGNDSLFEVSTIHSFVWELIRPYNEDIRDWLKETLSNEIIALNEQEEKGRSGTKASIDRQRKIESKSRRLEGLKRKARFTYNPNGDNQGKYSLSHSEVINIASSFLTEKPLIRQIMTRKFPILLIDESQDTKKELIDSFFRVQESHKEAFALGLFGDTMQRIYTDGKEKLGEELPDDWKKPEKKMNHRSGKRIVDLINDIRSDVDGQKQHPRTDKENGIVRLFIASNSVADKSNIEEKACIKMSEDSGDGDWLISKHTLAIEHKMIARRMGFIELFEPLYANDRIKTGLLDGTLSSLSLLTDQVLPLVEAVSTNDHFKTARVIKKYSPLLKSDYIQSQEDQSEVLKKTDSNVKELYELWANDNDPSIKDVIAKIYELNLFNIPKPILPIFQRTPEDIKEIEASEATEEEGQVPDKNDIIESFETAFLAPFSQVKPYKEYVSGESPFTTHQGVKGLQYPRVLVIIDDSEAGGFLFSYDKLFGAKELTATDERNIREGKDSSIDRTKRLFYVACSRAERSLAVLVYTDEPEKAKETAINLKWFKESEIEILT